MSKAMEIPDFITKQRPSGMGFPAALVEAIRKKHDDESIIECDGVKIRIFAKHEAAWSDLVVIGFKPEPIVMFSCRLLASLCDQPLSELSPLQLLREVVEKIGLPFKCGTFEGKLLYNERIEKPPGDLSQLISGNFPKDHGFFLVSFIRKNADESVDVSIAFFVDLTVYDQWHSLK